MGNNAAEMKALLEQARMGRSLQGAEAHRSAPLKNDRRLFPELLSAEGAARRPPRRRRSGEVCRRSRMWVPFSSESQRSAGAAHRACGLLNSFFPDTRAQTAVRFAALRAAGRQPLLVIALHPHLAPVVAMMRFARKIRSIVVAHGLKCGSR